MSNKIGVVIAGGGAKGAFSVGVLKELVYNRKLNINVAYGTSVGALTATALSFNGIEGLEKLWLQINKISDLFKFQWSSLLLQTNSIYSPEPLKKIVENVIKGGKPSFDVFAVTCSMNTGKIRYVHHSEPDFLNLVVASCCIPAVLEPYRDVNNDVWADGGLRELVPLKHAVNYGCDELHVILQSPVDFGKRELKRGVISSVVRAVDIITYDVLLNDLENLKVKNCKDDYRFIKSFKYMPDKLLLDLLDFKPELIRKAILQGQEVARSVFK